MFQASPSQTNQAFEEEGLDGGGLKALASDLMVYVIRFWNMYRRTKVAELSCTL
ncbi:hypothetical protein NC653_025526 [Populus alba x Populus x berolinensis]|uniref:Uncharacterized protein n=1 Tax=Populus alba x Populus x berolinensis TaxID=444605 RepID=A0AAD6MBZ8_9ROSI|nr:hypothetical protein NC653_025526 [Populus alba x Populus x berolinensis]